MRRRANTVEAKQAPLHVAKIPDCDFGNSRKGHFVVELVGRSRIIRVVL